MGSMNEQAPAVQSTLDADVHQAKNRGLAHWARMFVAALALMGAGYGIGAGQHRDGEAVGVSEANIIMTEPGIPVHLNDTVFARPEATEGATSLRDAAERYADYLT